MTELPSTALMHSQLLHRFRFMNTRTTLPAQLRIISTPMQNAGLRLGAALVGLLFVVSGVMKIQRFDALAGVLAAKGVPLAPLALGLAVLVEVACGLALIVRWRTQAAAWLLAGFVVVATLLFHAFWAVDASQFQNQLNHFLKNVAILGALLALATARPLPR
jgi:putative oxidoreductase